MQQAIENVYSVVGRLSDLPRLMKQESRFPGQEEAVQVQRMQPNVASKENVAAYLEAQQRPSRELAANLEAAQKAKSEAETKALREILNQQRENR
jgi:hypothetical protein